MCLRVLRDALVSLLQARGLWLEQSAMHNWAAPRIFSHILAYSSVDRRDAPLGLAELGRVDIVNQNI